MEQKDNIIYLSILRCLFYVKAANGKGHGVHSPFVFKFIKEVLNVVGEQEQDIEIINKYALSKRQRKINLLLGRLCKYFQPGIVMIDEAVDMSISEYLYAISDSEQIKNFDRTVSQFNGLAILDKPWPIHQLNGFFSRINDAVIVLILNKHSNQVNRKAWKELKNHAAVTLSIDLFDIGMLFFRKENYEKQDFAINF